MAKSVSFTFYLEVAHYILNKSPSEQNFVIKTIWKYNSSADESQKIEKHQVVKWSIRVAGLNNVEHI